MASLLSNDGTNCQVVYYAGGRGDRVERTPDQLPDSTGLKLPLVGDHRPSGTVTFLFTDVEGSTRLWEEHSARMSAALAEHDRILRSAVDDGDGYIFATGGDSVAAAFAGAGSALEAALAAQVALTDLADGVPSIKVRMGVHTGRADERDGDYFGPELNRTARLMAAGHGGQVLVSGTTQELVEDTLSEGVTLSDLGQHQLKDLSRPVRIFQATQYGCPSDFPPLRSLNAFSHNLPIQLTSFVGREKETEELTRLIRDSRMVTLAGVGGSGKTRLALQIAAEMVNEFDDGCWLVELAPLTNPTRIISTVASVLGVPETPGEDQVDTLLSWLRDKRLLLILDNCEHVIDSAAESGERILEVAAGVKILATSREMLGVSGERAYRTRSLAAPESVEGSLLEYPAVRLFSERGQLANDAFRLTSENAADVVQIVSRLDGMPLAIELAAARLRMLTPAQIAIRLDDRFRLLTGGSRTALPRQQTLEAAIDWSYDLLTEKEKLLFSRLSVFMGGFTLASAESVCGVEPLDRLEVLDLLGHLVDKSLVQTDDRGNETRYLLMETLRQYARVRLAESEEVALMRARHSRHFSDLALEAEPHLRSPDEEYWMTRLDDELDNLRQAIGWSIESGDGDLAQATAGALYRYFMFRWRGAEGREWAEAALAVSEEPSAARAKALLAAGTLAMLAFDPDPAQARLDEAVEMARTVGANDTLAAATHNLASLAVARDDPEEAARLWEESLALNRRFGFRDGEVLALGTLTRAALDHEDYELAVARAAEAIEVAESLGSERVVYHAREMLFVALRLAGRLDEAEKELERRVEIVDRLGFEHHPGENALLFAILAMDRGDLASATLQLVEGVRDFTGIPDYQTLGEAVGIILGVGSDLLSRCGEGEMASRLLSASDTCAEATQPRALYEQRDVDITRERLETGFTDFDEFYEEGKHLGRREALELMMAALERQAAANVDR